VRRGIFGLVGVQKIYLDLAGAHSINQAALSAVTFCSWHPVITMEGVDRFVDRAIGANSAIRATGGTTPWYPSRQCVRCTGPRFS